MGIIKELQLAGKVALDLDYQTGSLLDLSGNANVSTVVGAPRWDDCDGERGLRMWPGANAINVTDSPSIRFSQMTACIKVGTNTDHASNQRLICKPASAGDYDLYVFNNNIQLYSAGVGGAVAIPASPARWWAVRKPSGLTAPKFWKNGVALGSGVAFTMGAQSAAALSIGNYGVPYNAAYRTPIQRVLLLNDGTITDAQIAQIYLEMMAERSVMGLPNRIFSFPKTSDAAGYAASATVLHTDFAKQNDGKVRDFTGNYPGTITGCPTPGPEGRGQVFDGVDDNVSFGDLVQLNNATKAIIEWDFQTKEAAITNGDVLWSKGRNANQRFDVEFGLGGGVAGLTLRVENGAASLAATSTAVARAKQWQHALLAVDLDQSANADKVRLFLDGDKITLGFGAPPLPATLFNAIGVPFIAASDSTLPNNNANIASRLLKIRTGQTITDDQSRQAYLENFAREIDWQVPGEDVPVSLEASVGAGRHIGSWTVISGTWKHSEDSLGRRWIECVTAGVISTSKPVSFGTTIWTVVKAQDPVSTQVMLTASVPGAYNASAAQNGYLFYINPGEVVAGARITAGAVALSLFTTVAAYVALGTTYRFAHKWRPSDGQQTLLIRGGVYANWTVVAANTGANPVADPTHPGSSFMTLNFGPGDKLLTYDPTIFGRPASIRHFAGVLDPTVSGELPQ